MPESVKQAMLEGKNKILLFRLLKESDKEAAKLAFQTDHTFELSRDTDSIPTKDGTVVKLGELEGEVTGIEAVQSKGDPTAAMLQTAVIDGEKLELWEVTVDDDLKEGDKYPAMYAQGYLTTWSASAPTEDESTYSGDFVIELVPQFGLATLTAEQEDAVQYAFRDTIANAEGGNGGVEG